MTGRRWAALLLLWLFFALAVTAIPRLSLTADEPVYIGAGYAFLRTGDLRLATAAQHPPLMQELVALPLLLQPGPPVAALDGWETAEMARFAPAFVAWYGEALPAATYAARLVVVLLATVWGAALFRWAASWFGDWGGLLALGLFAADPNILAHATLATTDIGFAAFSFIGLWLLTRALSRGGDGTGEKFFAPTAALALGAALSAKSTGFFTLLLAWGLILLIRPPLRRVLWLVIVPPLVLWAAYGFEIRPFPLATHYHIWQAMRTHLAAGHTAYLHGQIGATGWRTYYPLAFLLKTPPVTLLTTGLGLLVGLRALPRRWRAESAAWLFLGGYLAATLLSTVNTGYRFLLPLLPFLYLLAGRLPRIRRGYILLAAICPLWLLMSALRLSPHYLTYFSPLAGGPDGGYRYLVDSNLDWGQSFIALADYLDAHHIPEVNLSYYTYTDPALYGVRYRPLPPSPDAPPLLARRFDPAPGVYVIGATTLQGVMLTDPDTYDWFRHRPPEARPGHALFLYRVPPREPPPLYLAQCTTPTVPLTEAAIADGFGRDDLRLLFFDCGTAWVYPQGAGGWYALFRPTALADDPFIRRRLADARLTYEQHYSGQLPPFAIYESSAPAAPPVPLAAPVRLGPLTLLGYARAPGPPLEIETWWRVESRPERPLSLMLHLVGPGGTPVVVGDGLGVPREQWQAGDIIVQRHRLPLPDGAPPGDYTPEAGAYWLDTLERWRTATGADTIPLPPVTVRP